MTSLCGEDFVTEFDFWLATQKKRKAENITAPFISNNFHVQYDIAKAVLEYASKVGVMEKYYLLMCSNAECHMPIRQITKDELGELMNTSIECDSCDHETEVIADNLYVVYRRIEVVNISPEQLNKEIEKRLGISVSEDRTRLNVNFNNAGSGAEQDVLSGNIQDIMEAIYSPSESAYKQMKAYYNELDAQYKTTKEKGDAYERLVCFTLKQIKGVSISSKVTVHDGANQFDCTGVVHFSCIKYPVMDYLAPTFLGECKNTKSLKTEYYDKLFRNMMITDCQVGILFSRVKVSNEMKRNANLIYIDTRKEARKILINISADKKENDWTEIIDNRKNILELIMNKISEVTTGADQDFARIFSEATI